MSLYKMAKAKARSAAQRRKWNRAALRIKRAAKRRGRRVTELEARDAS